MEFNLADLWERVVDTVPEREAVVCTGRRLTFAQLDERADRLAHHLQRCGVEIGDHLALNLSNGSEYLEAMLAAFKLRAVPVNVNYRYMGDELAFVLDDSDAVVVVTHQGFAPTLAAVAADREQLRAILVVEDGTGAPWDELDAAEYEGALAAAAPGRDFGARSPDDHYILYTGGTTGMPKGVVWRSEDIFFGALGGGDEGDGPIARPEEISERLGRPSRCLPLAPFMHGTAHWIALRTLLSGGTVVIVADRGLDPVRAWEVVARERVTFLAIVGDAFARPLVEALDELPAGVDVTCCTAVLSGGAVLSSAIKRRWVERMPGLIVVDGYGTSETGAQGRSVTMAGLDDDRSARFHVDDVTTVVGEQFEPLPPGVVGRLATRGHIPLGYYRDPVRTAETFPVIDGVRWSVPGDAARIEPDGTITVLGRGSGSINTGGEKVYPEEVELALKEQPAIADAVVVGVPDELWGERVVAVVLLSPGCTQPIHVELERALRERLAAFKVPRELVVVDELRRSASGKPDYEWARSVAVADLRSGV